MFQIAVVGTKPAKPQRFEQGLIDLPSDTRLLFGSASLLGAGKATVRTGLTTACVALSIWTASAQISLSPNSEMVTDFAPLSAPPDPSRDQYDSVFEQTSQTPIPFNGVTQHTRSVVIDGIVVVFDGSIAGGYWERYNGATDIAQLTINASNVVFRSHMALPGTSVTINCKDLRFEGNPVDGSDNAALDLTPLPTGPATTNSQNGANGQAAGNFTLNIATFSSDTLTNRFIARGGRGGDPGPGANGLAGNSLPDAAGSCSGSRGGTGDGGDGMPGGSVVYIDYQQTGQKKANPVHELYCGTAAWPTSGQNAVPAGKPGNPGPAGTVTTSVDVSAYSDLSGGVSGAQGPNYTGGQAGTPSPAYWAIVQWNADGGPYWHQWAGPVYTTPGTDASSPPADVPAGANGIQVILSPANTTWVTPGYGYAELAHAKDLYRGEYYQLAQSVLAALAADLGAATNSAQAPALLALQGEAQTLLHRLATGNTYWNWPVNDAPLLSLGVTEAAFDSAIENSLYPVYLDQVLHSANLSISNKLVAVQQSKQSLLADLVKQAGIISNTLPLLPTLQQTAVQLSNTIAQLQFDQQLTAQLELQEAQMIIQNQQIQKSTPAWQTVLRIGSAIADFTPYGPATTALVNGIINVDNDLNSINSNSPWQTIAAVPDLTSALGTAFGTGATSFTTVTGTLGNQINILDGTTPTSWGAYLTNLQAITAPLKTGVTNLTALLSSTPIPSSQVQAELATIKSTDPTLTLLANELSTAMSNKQALAEAAASAVQTISTAYDRIQADLLAISACSDQLDNPSLALSYDLLKAMDAIANRALDQIAYYQALMAAAYRYQWLAQYPGDLQLNDLIQQVQLFAASSTNVTPSDFAPIVSLYKLDLTAIDSAIVDYYNTNFVALQTDQIYDLTADQLAQLNGPSGSLQLNLARTGIFPPWQEDIRIVGIGFFDIQLKPLGSNYNFATFTITIQHSGSSSIAHNGNLYSFYHYPSDDPNPVTWSAKVDLKHGTTTVAIPSPVEGSLIGALVGLPNATVQQIFANLGADSDLQVSVQAYSNTGLPILLTGLSLDVQYEYRSVPSGVSTVEVLAPQGLSEGLAPEISVSTPDLQQRTNGVLPFVRQYNKSTTSSIEITAPAMLEGMTFTNWVDQFGNVITSSPSNSTTLILSLANSSVVTPMYQQAPGLFAVASQGQTVLCWPTPSPVPYGTPLGTNQLNAIGNAGGTYTYSPAAGTILPSGTNVLSVRFTPDDPINYQAVTASVSAVVYPPPVIHVGAANGGLALVLTVAPNAAYVIQSAPSITGPWAVAAAVMADASGALNYNVPLSTNAPAQFFRAMAQ